ncbi:MAG: membrane or secreted protein [Bacteroidota bacterium]|nr:membrane or secreted protein [Bacteroidota bacterium]
MRRTIVLFITVASIISCTTLKVNTQPSLTGSWHNQSGNIKEVMVFQDAYFSYTKYDQANKLFIETKGGSYHHDNNSNTLHLTVEFNTTDKENVGKMETYEARVSNNQLTTNVAGNSTLYNRLDDGSGALAGTWHFTGRMNNGNIQRTTPGARKTVKILSGTRFQWMAINTETKEFFGTGGGTYTFNNGVYSENIEFFSRDSSRVGASLQFEGSVANHVWTHKGNNSRGEPLHEEWTRVGKY